MEWEVAVKIITWAVCIFAGGFSISFGISFGTVIAYGLRDKISYFVANRSGIEVRTNDVQVWSKVVGKLEQIDTNTSKNVRKATAGMMLIAPKKHATSADVMLVNINAQQPLIFAAYENHHTREIAVDGGDVYLAEKTNDVINAVKYLNNKFPELTNERCEALTCYWYKKIVAPIVRRACAEKAVIYGETMAEHNTSQVIKEMCAAGIVKNQNYINAIDVLCQRDDVEEKSSIIYKG